MMEDEYMQGLAERREEGDDDTLDLPTSLSEDELKQILVKYTTQAAVDRISLPMLINMIAVDAFAGLIEIEEADSAVVRHQLRSLHIHGRFDFR